MGPAIVWTLPHFPHISLTAWVIPANEELVVAREVEKVLRTLRR